MYTALQCPALPQLSHGAVSPETCTASKQTYGSHCSLTCEHGYQLKGPHTRICGGRASVWSGKGSANKCVDNTPPLLRCPDDVVVPTDLGEDYASINWTLPKATDYSPPIKVNRVRFPAGSLPDSRTWVSLRMMPLFGGFSRDLLFSPALARRSISTALFIADNSGRKPALWSKPSVVPPLQMKIGITTITYTASDSSKNKAKCIFTVTVEGENGQRRNARKGETGDLRENLPTSCIIQHDSYLQKSGVTQPGIEPDREPPVVDQCEEPPPFLTDSAPTELSWETPLFHDNSGEPVQIYRYPEEDLFDYGTTLVTYTASDSAGNNATCSFNVTVEAVRDYSSPTKGNRFDSWRRLPPDFRTWESCRTMPLVGGFSPGSALALRRCSILTSLHSHRLSRPRLELTLLKGDVITRVPTFPAENVCKSPPDPINGHANCTSSSDFMHCTLTCQEGYAVAVQPRDFFCTYDETGGLLSPDFDVDPFPDCSGTRPARRTGVIQWRVVKCCEASWCLLTAVRSRCTQQETKLNTFRPLTSEQQGTLYTTCLLSFSVTVLPNSISQDSIITLSGEETLCQDPAFLSQLEPAMKENIAEKLQQICGSSELVCQVGDMKAACDQILSSIEQETNTITRRRRSVGLLAQPSLSHRNSLRGVVHTFVASLPRGERDLRVRFPAPLFHGFTSPCRYPEFLPALQALSLSSIWSLFNHGF
ncbi:hypothetical protein PR048_008350 [Dryococelus australis]|uniref:Sushi domain-containing protein n=1 Tax=Dryococelus australis TaxID=614101 RepID=A0ABQ9HWV9_9NEOP|nr:hypothetical protein PR048_008350 [Dryococelus australis]